MGNFMKDNDLKDMIDKKLIILPTTSQKSSPVSQKSSSLRQELSPLSQRSSSLKKESSFIKSPILACKSRSY